LRAHCGSRCRAQQDRAPLFVGANLRPEARSEQRERSEKQQLCRGDAERVRLSALSAHARRERSAERG
jgi:hypothetical protein